MLIRFSLYRPIGRFSLLSAMSVWKSKLPLPKYFFFTGLFYSAILSGNGGFGLPPPEEKSKKSPKMLNIATINSAIKCHKVPKSAKKCFKKKCQKGPKKSPKGGNCIVSVLLSTHIKRFCVSSMQDLKNRTTFHLKLDRHMTNIFSICLCYLPYLLI